MSNASAELVRLERAFKTPAEVRAGKGDGFEGILRRLAPWMRRFGIRYRLQRGGHCVRFPEVEVVLPHLSAEFAGFRVAQISDLHFTILCEPADYRALFDQVAARKPDLIVYTGDYVSHDAALIAPSCELMGRLQAPHGAYAVLGNHDYWEDANETARQLERNGIRLLVNEWTLIHRGRQALALAGIDDCVLGEPDLAATLDGIPPHLPVILLSHVPCVFLDPRVARAGLVLSGHVHGGQINLPLIGPPWMPELSTRRYLQGYYRNDYTQLYLSAGVGTSAACLRWRAQPEIPILILRQPCREHAGHELPARTDR